MEEDLIRAYYSTVSYLDALIGKLLKSLDDFGLRDNTTIVFWSDHGFFLGEHGFWCKHHTFQEAIHVPLLISSPGKKKNAVSNALVEYVDIYPTICEIAGIDSPNYIHGKSMVPILENPNLRFKSEIYSRYQFREVVQDHDYSYHEILNYNKLKHATTNIFLTLTTIIVNFSLAFLIVLACDFISSSEFGLMSFFNIS